jgi:2,4-dienoyl-CoA reductase-like NADH-dependent reductase (Old Yellow Enzyme family)
MVGNAKAAQFALQNGAVPAIQLAHAGRKSGMQRPWFGNGPLNEDDFERGDMPWPAVGPSAVPVAEGWPLPEALSHAQIATLIGDFVSAAQRALAAGYKIAEIHGAHGYLLHSFLSPMSNKRTDDYGGNLAGRMRLVLEITQAVRDVWPQELPLFFRTSAVDGVTEGWSLDDTVTLARALKQFGIDVMDCSSSGIGGSATAGNAQKRQPGFQVPYAERVRTEAQMTTMAVGLITHPQQAEDILAQGRADLIAIGREALVNPMWAHHAAAALGHDTIFERWPEQSGWWLANRQKTSDFYQPE